MSAWHTRATQDVLSELSSRADSGLSDGEIARRQEQYGPNELTESKGRSSWAILWEQLSGIMIVILLVAAGISALLGDFEDAIVILIIVVLNAALGFSQEYRAEQSMAALRNMTVPTVRVRRNGKVLDLPARELVPGDIMLLEAGNRVPADGRLIENASLRIQEAALTGESVAVEKSLEPVAAEDTPLGDRRNMAYSGTEVIYGRGAAVVTATGMQTELGKIADLIQNAESEQTPLQKRLDDLGKQLALLALAIVAVVIALGLFRGEQWQILLLTAVSLAVAAVPEGLPAVVTICLALGAQRMLKRQALIRKLPAVETLGSVTVICSDKTGTLTENRMTVTVMDVAGDREDIAGTRAIDLTDDMPESSALLLMMVGGTLCNDATLEDAPEIGQIDAEITYRAIGDPTEGALVIASARQGLPKPALEARLPRVDELPFDSDRKRMTTVHQLRQHLDEEHRLPQLDETFTTIEHAFRPQPSGTGYVAFTKGAVDSLLDVTDTVWVGNTRVPFNEEWRTRIGEANIGLAKDGLRVLGIAFRPFDDRPHIDNGLEHQLTFVGMVGMIDPARPEVRDAVKTCQEAGVRVVMITGDHPVTAAAIARELGIGDGRALTGQEINKLDEPQLARAVSDTSIFARVSPENKLQLVKALQSQNNIVSMTGDGVNDAPALRQADIGVAMGITGTDVSKEASDMVLLDDNFSTIVAAVTEGRVIYDNIRKFIRYILTGNVGEIFVMLIAPFLGMPLALLPLQILWINLVTDGLPALALGVEPAERDTMKHPPRSPAESILGQGLGWRIGFGGVLVGGISLAVGYWFWRQSPDLPWQTMIFTTLTFAQMAGVLTLRSERASVLGTGFFSNPALIGAVLLTLVLQLAVIYLPFLQGLFETEALSWQQLAICGGLALIVFFAFEIEKLISRVRS